MPTHQYKKINSHIPMIHENFRVFSHHVSQMHTVVVGKWSQAVVSRPNNAYDSTHGRDDFTFDELTIQQVDLLPMTVV